MKKKLKMLTEGKLAGPRSRKSHAASVDVVGALNEIAHEQRIIDMIEKDLSEHIRELRATAESEAKSSVVRVAKLVDDIALFATRYRGLLTNDGRRKTVTYSSGKILWRLTPPSVHIRNAKLVLAQLKEKGLTEMVRVKETIDRLMMLKHPKRLTAIKGVSFLRREEFVVKPSDYGVQTARNVASLKRRVRAKLD